MFRLLIIMFLTFPMYTLANDLMDLIAARNQLMQNHSSSTVPSTSNSGYPLFNGTEAPSKNFDIQVNENEYLLGSGDSFLINLFGTINKSFNASVDLEGNVIIPSLGSTNVKGKTLKEGKQAIRDLIFNEYKEVEISISLSNSREFKVYLLGNVQKPGAYYANGATRVSDVVSNENESIDYSKMRCVTLQNPSYSDRNVDLALFYHSNIITQNPYLIEGDRIFVNKTFETLLVSGAVNYPGSYGYVDGDSLGLILQVVGGLSRGADSTKIMITRFFNNIDSLVIFELNLKEPANLGFKLEKDDRILVKSIPDYRIHRQVKIYGEVKYPGIYPIQKDKTKLFEIFEMAGGLTDQAFLKGSKMIRRKHTNVGDKEFERILKLPQESLSPLEKSYLKTRLTEEDKRVNIDFDELLNKGDDINNIVLRDGDEITIAHKNLSVKMTGAVINPGLIEFKKGENISYYIKRAGGFNSRAKKRSVLIMKAGTEVWLEPKETDELEPGDAIWVPDKGYRNGYSIAKEIIVVLGSVAALVISAFTIHDFLTNE